MLIAWGRLQQRMNQRSATGAQLRRDQCGDRAFGDPAADCLIQKLSAGRENGRRRCDWVREALGQQLPKIDNLITPSHEGIYWHDLEYVQVNIFRANEAAGS